jgi:hypothetical protein
VKRVLLVSETPVAGTVVRFAEALNASGKASAVPFVLRAYKSCAFDLPNGAMGSLPNWGELLCEEAAQADAIVLHNVTQQSTVDIVMSGRRADAPVAYHLHSPPFEPPLYAAGVIEGNTFDQLYCVAQGYHRFYAGAAPIANIIPDPLLFASAQRRNAVFVGHLRTTNARWSRKVPQGFARTLADALAADAVPVFGIEKLFGSESVPYRTFTQALQGFNFVVDDVCSGLFHQISLEGLKSGCIVFSAADEASLESFCEAAECPVPPFHRVAGPDDIAEAVRSYVRRPTVLAAARRRNAEFSDRYLSESRLRELFVKRFTAI